MQVLVQGLPSAGKHWRAEPGRAGAHVQIFNILCEQPETVAAFLVPRARTVAARGQAGRYIKFLTLRRAMLRFLTAPLHSNRFFDGQGATPAQALARVSQACQVVMHDSTCSPRLSGQMDQA